MILVALLPSVAFGCMSLLTMKLQGDQRQQTLGMMLGGLIVALVLWPFSGGMISLHLWLIAMGCGFMLGMGIHFQIMSFHVLGVSRTMPISTASQLILMSVLGVLVLGEWRAPGALPVGIVALVCLVFGVIATTWTEKSPSLAADQSAIEGIAFAPAPTAVPPESPRQEKVVLDWPKGILYLVLSTLPLVLYLIILRWFDIDAIKGFLPLVLGAAVAGLLFSFPQFSPHLGKRDTRWQRSTLWQLIPGLVWCAGLAIMQYATEQVGVATGFTLSQLGVIISTVGGITLLGEKRSRKELWVLSVGIVLLVVGAILVGVAKGLDA
ncbi:multidrug DMT transporter permease [Actinomycetaceae bacterium WB03_NA08]|uniref:Multidrug DMT transporter permease n=1 Tax=Scrofimicrobium canadense TaxID=2652290 RepID=A0A6N7VS37_9ACTO|nr:GRP family sugar transporter [Scrofimicrobium canadense]MSS83770.1 multidrug DMT transporter permease [Scrofimicrobium canadense]